MVPEGFAGFGVGFDSFESIGGDSSFDELFDFAGEFLSREVELVLESHEAVDGASVVAAPDAAFGECVVAFVTRHVDVGANVTAGNNVTMTSNTELKVIGGFATASPINAGSTLGNAAAGAAAAPSAGDGNASSRAPACS